MSDLEKARNININTNILLCRLYLSSANYPLFSNSNLIEIKHQFFYPTVELAKLSMRNDYVSLIVDVYQIKIQTILNIL